MIEKDALIVTVDEVARRLQISRNSAYSACRNGQIPIVRIGKRILIPRAALERMLNDAGKDKVSES